MGYWPLGKLGWTATESLNKRASSCIDALVQTRVETNAPAQCTELQSILSPTDISSVDGPHGWQEHEMSLQLHSTDVT